MKLTVIVTTYNIAEYLPRFFESMISQTFRDYTLIVLDDGSEDESLEVCREYEKKDSRIRVIASEHLGIAGIKNKAMEYIETEYTAYVDGDDYVEPEYLEHLMNAIEKYNADLAVSRVVYHTQEGRIEGEFSETGEMLIRREEFREKLPMLLDERRLNYVYGKAYRSALLKEIRVEDDVKQGMDTMINFMYIQKANSVVLIDDPDYHYIRYKSRSITSYSGKDAFERLVRINTFVRNACVKMDMLTEEMERTIDKRVLISAEWVINRIVVSDCGADEKAESISDILHEEEYVAAYERQKDHADKFDFELIKPQGGDLFLDNLSKKESLERWKKKVLQTFPAPIVRVYHMIKGVHDE